MKNFLIAVAFACLIALGLSSCKGQEKCPAYGEASTEQVQEDKA